MAGPHPLEPGEALPGPGHCDFSICPKINSQGKYLVLQVPAEAGLSDEQERLSTTWP